MKTEFLLSATETGPLDRAIRQLGGRRLSDCSWIVEWGGNAMPSAVPFGLSVQVASLSVLLLLIGAIACKSNENCIPRAELGIS
jgi:hypothetical protein